LSFWQEYRAERAILALQDLLPHRVRALRDRVVTEIPSEDLVPGDVVLLREGDDVPADCRVIEALGVRVNNATVTGESLPKARDAGPSPEEDVLRARNVLLAGTSVVSGEARAVVFAMLPTVTLSLAMASQRMAGRHALVRRLPRSRRWAAPP
jgi:P-type E1-E2 ATPase